MKKTVIFPLLFAFALTKVADASDPNLVSHWNFDEGWGTVAHDSVGGHDGIVYGAQWTSGRVGGALKFCGWWNYVDVGNLDVTGDWTVCFWAKLRDNTGYVYYPIGLSDPIVGVRMGGAYPTVKQHITVYMDSNTKQLFSRTTVQAGVWYHVAITKDGDNYSIYVDGKHDKTGELIDIDLTDFKIGVRPDMQGWFDGIVDDVGVWNCALPLGDIEDPNPGAINYVRLNGISGTGSGSASEPNPADGSMDAPLDVVLSWRPGDYVADVNGHDVYLSDVKGGYTIYLAGDVDGSGQVDFGDVSVLSTQWLREPENLELSADIDGNGIVDLFDFAVMADNWMESVMVYKGRYDTNSYDPCGLELGTTYYWRVDEVNEPNVWPGEVWSFTVGIDEPALTNALTYQITPTYDGSGQAMHPDVIYFPDGWRGYKYWMAMTPLTYGDSSRENPSILASNDGSSWEVPPGLTNPLIGFPGPPGSYNADTDIVYNDDTDELWVYFFRYWSNTKLAKLTLMRSSDGINWSEPEYLITWDRHIAMNEGSFAVIKQGSDWHYWAWNSTAPHGVTYRHSEDGKDWSEGQNITFSPQPLFFPWHLDVIYVPDKSEYWMLFNGPGSSVDYLFFAKSRDRLNWTPTVVEVLSPSAYRWDRQRIYRSTLLYDSNSALLRVWYSAEGSGSVWHTGYTETNY